MGCHLMAIQEVFIYELYPHLNIIEIYFHFTFLRQVFVKCLHSGSICNKRWKFNYEDIAILRIDEPNRLGNMIAIVTDVFTYILLTIDVLYMLTWMLPIVKFEPSDNFWIHKVYRSVFCNVLLTYIDHKFMVKHFCYFTTFYKYCCYLFIW